jgi:putative SOS response-associated peptidase YedK
MCNLYSMTKNQDAIRILFKVSRDTTSNMPPLPGVFPDMLAPVVRTARDGERVFEMFRWGFPPPPPPSAGPQPVTNVRNTASGYWRGWLEPRFRCLVPATSFCEWTDTRPKVTHWFALNEARPLFAFAGIWRPWTGVRGPKSAPIEGEHLVFLFLTCASNDLVRPIHAKAMPVILTTHEECDRWLTAPTPDAIELQRPLPTEALRIVASGEREDALAA